MNKIEINSLTKVESSNIDIVGFDDNTTYVQFKNGSIYKYPDTSRDEYLSLINAKSVGKSFNIGYKQKDFLKLEDTILTKKEDNPKTMIVANEQERLFIAHCMSEWFVQCGTAEGQPQWQQDLYERIYGEKFEVFKHVDLESSDLTLDKVTKFIGDINEEIFGKELIISKEDKELLKNIKKK